MLCAYRAHPSLVVLKPSGINFQFLIQIRTSGWNRKLTSSHLSQCSACNCAILTWVTILHKTLGGRICTLFNYARKMSTYIFRKVLSSQTFKILIARYHTFPIGNRNKEMGCFPFHASFSPFAEEVGQLSRDFLDQ